MKQYSLKFENHVLDNGFDQLPAHKGIYLFRVSIPTSKDCIESFIIYIGKADGENGLKGRINDSHEHIDDARKLVNDINSRLLTGDKKCYLTISYSSKTEYTNDDIERIESALIFIKKPILNDKSKYSFNYQKTVIEITGNHKADLDEEYIVEDPN